MKKIFLCLLITFFIIPIVFSLNIFSPLTPPPLFMNLTNICTQNGTCSVYSLNISNIICLQGICINSWNATNISINSSFAGIGNCPNGYVVQNTTTGGVQCVLASTGGNPFNQTLNTQDNVTFNRVIVNGSSLNPDVFFGYSNVRLITASGTSGRIGFEYFDGLGTDTIWQIDNGGNSLRFFNDTTVFARINQTGIYEGQSRVCTATNGICTGTANTSWNESRANILYANKSNELWINVSGNATFVSGKVGIGTVSPMANLHVNSTVNIGSNYQGFTGVYNFVINDTNAGIIMNRNGTDEPFIRITTDTANSGGQFRGINGGGIRITDASSVTEWFRVNSLGTNVSRNLKVNFNISVGSNLSLSGFANCPALATTANGFVICNTTITSGSASTYNSSYDSKINYTYNSSYYLMSNPNGYLNYTVNNSYYLASNPNGYLNYTYNSSYVKNNGDNVTGRYNFTGNITIQDEHGQYRNLDNVITHLEEMQINTLLDKSRSSLSVVGSELNYTLVAVYGVGEWNFNGTIIGVSSGEAVANATVTLACGTNITPKVNNIYFYLNSGVPTLATSEVYPSYTHIDVGTFVVGNCSNDNAVIYSYNRNRYEIDAFVQRSLSRWEKMGTLYDSGFDINASTNNMNISTGSFFNNLFLMTTTNNATIANGFYFINGSGNFIQNTSLTRFIKYADGTAFSGGPNERINIIWGIVPINTTGDVGPTQAKLVAILPNNPGAGNEYKSIVDAVADVYETANFYPPNNYVKQVFTPVARTIYRPSTGLFELFPSGKYYQDIRGKITSGGGNAGGNIVYNINSTSVGNNMWLNDSKQIYLNDSFPNFVNMSFKNISAGNLTVYGYVGIGTVNLSERFNINGSGIQRMFITSINNGTSIHLQSAPGYNAAFIIGDETPLNTYVLQTDLEQPFNKTSDFVNHSFRIYNYGVDDYLLTLTNKSMIVGTNKTNQKLVVMGNVSAIGYVNASQFCLKDNCSFWNITSSSSVNVDWTNVAFVNQTNTFIKNQTFGNTTFENSSLYDNGEIWSNTYETSVSETTYMQMIIGALTAGGISTSFWRNDSVGPRILFARYRGDPINPSKVLAGDQLGITLYAGYGDTGIGYAGEIQTRALEDFYGNYFSGGFGSEIVFSPMTPDSGGNPSGLHDTIIAQSNYAILNPITATLVGSTTDDSSGAILQVNGNINALAYQSGGYTGITDCWDGSLGGQICIAGGSTYSVTDDPSDQKFKSNISDLSLNVSKFWELKPSEWFWNNNLSSQNKSGTLGFGLVANDVEKVYPELIKNGTTIKMVSKNVTRQNKQCYINDTTNMTQCKIENIIYMVTEPKVVDSYKTIDYAGMIALLTQKLQDQEYKTNCMQKCIVDNKEYVEMQLCVTKC